MWQNYHYPKGSLLTGAVCGSRVQSVEILTNRIA
jgi:hypothetical protein